MYDIPFMWNIKINDINEFTYKTETDSHASRKSLWLPGQGGEWWRRMKGRATQGVWDRHVHTAIFKMNSQTDG